MFSISIFSESGRVLLVLLPYILWVCGLGRVRVNQVSGLYTCDLPKLGAANRKGSWGSRGISFGCETQCSKNFQKRQDILIRFTSTAQGGGGSFKYRTLWESRWVVVMHGWQSESTYRPKSFWSCAFLEWLQWLQGSSHPQLLDVVWCIAAVVINVVHLQLWL